MKVVIWLLDRFVPTLLIGMSAALLTLGVLSYAPSAFGQWQTASPTFAGNPLFESPSPETTALPTGSGAQPSSPPVTQAPSDTASLAPSGWPTDLPTTFPSSVPPSGQPTDQPTGGPTPPANGSPRPSYGPTPIPGPGAHATRIVIPSLGIDLPVVPSDLVVPGNVGNYPLCDVAMYMIGFVDPGEPGTTYIYGHAQDGMFAPLLHASKYNNGASMIGALVKVYSADNLVHIYEITLVKRHSTDLSITRVPAGVHQLVLQTSEGWSGHPEKLQIKAQPLAVLPASYADAHPTPHPRVCLPG